MQFALAGDGNDRLDRFRFGYGGLWQSGIAGAELGVMTMKNLVIGALTGAVAFAALGATAQAHPYHASGYAGVGWRFDASRCPDLVEDARDRREDRRDRRYDNGRRDRFEDRADRRENRRDERVTVCPARAWVWDGPRKGARNAARPSRATIFYDARSRQYYRYGPNRTRVTIVLR